MCCGWRKRRRFQCFGGYVDCQGPEWRGSWFLSVYSFTILVSSSNGWICFDLNMVKVYGRTLPSSGDDVGSVARSLSSAVLSEESRFDTYKLPSVCVKEVELVTGRDYNQDMQSDNDYLLSRRVWDEKVQMYMFLKISSEKRTLFGLDSEDMRLGKLFSWIRSEQKNLLRLNMPSRTPVRQVWLPKRVFWTDADKDVEGNSSHSEITSACFCCQKWWQVHNRKRKTLSMNMME